MGGENWETRRGRSRAGLLRSPRDLHLDLVTFGARQSLRNFAPLSALLGHRGHRLCAKMNLGTPFGVFPTASETGSRSALVRVIRN